MDVMAFEATALDDDLTLSEAFETLPPAVKRSLRAGTTLSGHLLHLGVLVLALLGCVATACLAICWMCLFWVQTRLLLLNSRLLRAVYKIPQDQGKGAGARGINSRVKADDSSVDGARRENTKGRDQAASRPKPAFSSLPSHLHVNNGSRGLQASLRNNVDERSSGVAVVQNQSDGIDKAREDGTVTSPGRRGYAGTDEEPSDNELPSQPSNQAAAQKSWLAFVTSNTKAAGLASTSAGFSSNQLAEAASFAREATRSGQKRRPVRTVEHRSRLSDAARARQQSSTLHDPRGIARAIGSAQSQPVNRTIPETAGNHGPSWSVVDSKPTSTAAVSTLSNGQLPPHLRKAKEAKESKVSIQEDLVAAAPTQTVPIAQTNSSTAKPAQRTTFAVQTSQNKSHSQVPEGSTVASQPESHLDPVGQSAPASQHVPQRLAVEVLFSRDAEERAMQAESAPKNVGKSRDRTESSTAGLCHVFPFLRPARRTMPIGALIALNTSPVRIERSTLSTRERGPSTPVEYEDFQCQQCRRWSCIVKSLKQQRGGKCAPCLVVGDRIVEAQRIISGLPSKFDNAKSNRKQETSSCVSCGGTGDTIAACDGELLKWCSVCSAQHRPPCPCMGSEGVSDDEAVDTAHPPANKKSRLVVTYPTAVQPAEQTKNAFQLQVKRQLEEEKRKKQEQAASKTGTEHNEAAARAENRIQAEEAIQNQIKGAATEAEKAAIRAPNIHTADSSVTRDKREAHSDPKDAANNNDSRLERPAPGVPSGELIFAAKPATVRDNSQSVSGYLHPDLFGLDFAPASSPSQKSVTCTSGRRGNGLEPTALPFFAPSAHDALAESHPLQHQTSAQHAEAYDAPYATHNADANQAFGNFDGGAIQAYQNHAMDDFHSSFSSAQSMTANSQNGGWWTPTAAVSDVIPSSAYITTVNSRFGPALSHVSSQSMPRAIPLQHFQLSSDTRNVLSEDDFPPLGSARAENRAASSARPPGLGPAQPSRQTLFDSLVPHQDTRAQWDQAITSALQRYIAND